jgi:hypothetical protein
VPGCCYPRENKNQTENARKRGKNETRIHSRRLTKLNSRKAALLRGTSLALSIHIFGAGVIDSTGARAWNAAGWTAEVPMHRDTKEQLIGVTALLIFAVGLVVYQRLLG